MGSLSSAIIGWNSFLQFKDEAVVGVLERAAQLQTAEHKG